MQESKTITDAARALAVPTIRQILAKRRNAVCHSKPLILATLNADLARAVRAAIVLGLTDEAIEQAATHDWDVRLLTAILIRERAARVLLDEHLAGFNPPEGS